MKPLLAMVSLSVAVLMLAGCGESLPTRTFSVTVTDASGSMVAGDKVVVVNGEISGSCASGTLLNIVHTTQATVQAGPVVKFNYTLSYPGSYIEAVYIDKNGDNLLSSGDIVWGGLSDDFGGFCWDGVNGPPEPYAYDWNEISALIGSTTYTAVTASLDAGPASFEARLLDGEFLNMPGNY